MRALRVLREVDLIAAEDTRRTARLLQHYSIATPTTSLHEHNEHGKSPHLIGKLQEGLSIALVSDAGMPLVSDPGATLVRAARAASIPIQVVPGPSAITAALAGAGISGSFAFLGFPPASGKARKRWMTEVGQITSRVPAVFFESPHRLARTMRELVDILGNRPIIAARELTKVHETLVEQPIMAWLSSFADAGADRGEHVVIISAAGPDSPGLQQKPDDDALLAEIGLLTNNGDMGVKAASKALALKYGMSASELYALHARHNK